MTDRPPELRLFTDELIVDNFAGGGGASTGIRMATGRDPDLAINHDPEALAMYRANHPGTRVLCEDVRDVEPRFVCRGRRVGLLWASPDCTHHSKARGGKPFRDRNRARRRRGLAGVVLKWADQVRPRVICVENVEEFQHWGPLGEDGEPDPERRGQSFRRWRSRLENLGYIVETRELRACDFGAPTSRKRLFIVARCDGEAIEWPEPTHGPGRAAPWRTAAEVIDWTLPCPSIFDRARPLAEATLRRIARGVRRHVLEAAQPFLVPVTHHGDARVYAIDDPLRTITCANRGEQALVVPTLVQTGWGERPGQAPRVPGLDKPLGTIVADGQKHALVAAFLAKHYGGGPNGVQTPGQQMGLPLGTITAVDHHALVLPQLAPAGAAAARAAQVRAFLLAYYGTDQDPQLGLPLPTVTTRDRFAVVMVAGVEHVIVDIGMRMLSPRELYLAQGFPAGYVIDLEVDGRALTKGAQVRMVGNSVSPWPAAQLVRAQFQARAAAEVA